MDVVKFIYEDSEIEFTSTAMVNATQMAKKFGKLPAHFLANEETKAFIKAGLSYRNSDNSTLKTEADLVYVNQRHGTFMHRTLALRFAAWLDPHFGWWVFSTIEQILFGHYEELKKSSFEKLQAEKELEAYRKDMLERNPEFMKFLELEGKVTEAEKKRIKALKESMNQLRIDFFKKDNQKG